MNRASEIFRRSAIFVAVSAVLAFGAANASGAPLAFTANHETDTVSVIDTGTNTIVGKPIPVGPNPDSIAVTPDGRRVFVTDEGDAAVTVIDAASRSIVGTPIPVGHGRSTIAIAPDGLTAYVTAEESNKVTAIDTQTGGIIGSVVTIEKPYAIAISPDGRSMYVASIADDAIYVVDPRTLAILGDPIPVGHRPVSVIFTPDGRTAYVADVASGEVSAIDTATQGVTSIPTGPEPWGTAVTPDGRKLFVSDLANGSVEVIDTTTGAVVDTVPVGELPFELGMAPDGRTVYVGEYHGDVRAIDTAADAVIGEPIAIPGSAPWQVTVAPDRSPTAVATVPSATVGVPASFSAAASTDPDGSVVGWNWAFGDGGTATGVTATHTYGSPGNFEAKLSVVDDEGCGEAEVFTGRTALCSGGGWATHVVAVTSPSSPSPTVEPSNKFRFGRLVHNRKNGTARLQLTLPAAGTLVLTGPQVQMVRKRIGRPGPLWLTLHARVELNKKLKKTLRAKVRFRVTFTPTSGTPKSTARSIVLRRAPRQNLSALRASAPAGSPQ